VALHPLAQRFASVAAEYERGRPDYAPGVVGALAAELGLQPGATVLDLAAGTGKLSRTLVACGFDVVAVEPLPSLRDLLGERIGSARVHAGVAEQIPLPDSSVAAVTVADAFHWFDREAAVSEIARVLIDGGGLAVLSTVPDWSGASWAHELGTLVSQSRPHHPHFDGPPWRDSIVGRPGWSETWEVRVSTDQPTNPERIVDHLSSISWIAAMPEDERADTVAQIRQLVQSGQTPAVMPVQAVVGLATFSGYGGQSR
jgi:SAM-dependent methyltransferase